MSPTSYQAAPPRVIEYTRLADFPQLQARQGDVILNVQKGKGSGAVQAVRLGHDK